MKFYHMIQERSVMGPRRCKVLKRGHERKRHQYLSHLWLFSGLETMLSFMVWFYLSGHSWEWLLSCDGHCINQFWWLCSQATAGIVGDGTEEVMKVGELKTWEGRKDENTSESRRNYKNKKNIWLIKPSTVCTSKFISSLQPPKT